MLKVIKIFDEKIKLLIHTAALLSLSSTVGATALVGPNENEPPTWFLEQGSMTVQYSSKENQLALNYPSPNNSHSSSSFEIDPISYQAPNPFSPIQADNRKPIEKLKDQLKDKLTFKMLNLANKNGKTLLYFDGIKQEVVGKARYGRLNCELRFNENEANAKIDFSF